MTTAHDSLPILEQGDIRNFIAGTHDYYKGIYIHKFERKKVAFHDSCAVFFAISPESFYEPTQISINVETKGQLTSGMSIIENRVNVHSFMESQFFKPVNVTFFQKINVL